jgi:hypothetical protein
MVHSDGTGARSRPRFVPGRLTLLAVLALIQWAWLVKAVPQVHGNDFGIFYRSVRSATPYAGHPDNPATELGVPLTNLNPPHFNLIVTPFAQLPFGLACACWWSLNALLLATGLTVWLREQGLRWSRPHAVWALLWAPIVTMGFTGQVTAVLGVPLWLAYRSLTRGHVFTGGLLVGIVLSVKPILWPLALWLIVRRSWPAVAGAAVGAAACVAVGLAAYGPLAYRDWIAALGGIAWGQQVMNASLAAIGARLPVATPVGLWVAIGSALAAGTVWRTRTRHLHDAWLPVIAASLLASPLGWVYYGAWLLPGTTMRDWTRGPGLGWSAPLIAVAGLGNLWYPLWLTIGSCYGITLAALWWRDVRSGRTPPARALAA